IETKSYFNVHMHIIPRKYNFGGFELGTNMYVSSMSPEDLTKKLKID
ncbi:TPA: galactose-1-phosphate uridylyltransferase, partial [Clostridioides difficile]|nr:galactose-1-phosphate uridylyltransferase [Clostridioides difficile]